MCLGEPGSSLKFRIDRVFRIRSTISTELSLTIITFCVAFGLAVDDTVHLLARYREERAGGSGWR